MPLHKYELVDEWSMKLTVLQWNELKVTTSDLWSKNKFSLQEDESDNGKNTGNTPAKKCVYNLRFSKFEEELSGAPLVKKT